MMTNVVSIPEAQENGPATWWFQPDFSAVLDDASMDLRAATRSNPASSCFTKNFSAALDALAQLEPSASIDKIEAADGVVVVGDFELERF